MKKIILLLAIIAFVSCTENERLLYNTNDHDVYFEKVTKTNDSLYVSLLVSDEVSTKTVPVKLLGPLLSSPMKFKVEVVKEKTTAKEGIHYKALPEYFEFPADTTVFNMPIQVIKGAEDIKTVGAVLALRLVNTDDIGVAFEDRSIIRLIIADMLKVPTGTGYYGDLTAFISVFGEYSKVKHLMIVELMGHDLWEKHNTLYDATGYFTPYGRLLYKIITSGEYRDENGKLMVGWNVS